MEDGQENILTAPVSPADIIHYWTDWHLLIDGVIIWQLAIPADTGIKR